jgi:hypothetical protein
MPVWGVIQAKKSKDINPAIQEIGVFLNLINERKHPLDLLRELLSNAGSTQVGATRIEISYTKDKEGHIFEISDDGCGMYYTGNPGLPGHLDKFLGLGLSSIVGIESDEFSWKGLGSKLAYQSRRVDIEICAPPSSTFEVKINEPWETLNRREMPKPRLTEHPTQTHGTKIRVTGHPPFSKSEAFTFENIRTYLLHRTFAGYTRDRTSQPAIVLSVLGRTEELRFGFPEFEGIDFNAIRSEGGIVFDRSERSLFVDLEPKSLNAMRVRLKGLLTWAPADYALSDQNLNVGLVLSVKGIPYFEVSLGEYGSTTIAQARPGRERNCLVLECDAIQDQMNISRSDLVDSAKTDELKKIGAELFRRLETSQQYLEFRTLPEEQKKEAHGGYIGQEQKKIQSPEQNWVVLDRQGSAPVVLMREPENEAEVNALLWKLEALGALPFERFESLAYIGAVRGPDLLVNFQEDKGSAPHPADVIELERNFYNYKVHGHTPAFLPAAVCPLHSQLFPVTRCARDATRRSASRSLRLVCLPIAPGRG